MMNPTLSVRRERTNSVTLQDADALTRLGATEFAKYHHWEAAIHFLKLALKKDPNHVDAMFWLGVCYFHYQLYDKVEKILTKALVMSPERADCLCLLAYLPWEYASLTKSLNFLQRAIKVNSDWPMPKVELIKVFFNLGNLHRAKLVIEETALLLQQPIETPLNEIEQYLSHSITGKSWRDLDQRLGELIFFWEESNILKDHRVDTGALHK
jgi:tetratricopeptide (TPR) repeat protein